MLLHYNYFLTLSQKKSGFYVSPVQVFLKTLSEKEKLLVTSHFSFSKCFLPLLDNSLPFSSNLKLSSANPSVWKSLKFVINYHKFTFCITVLYSILLFEVYISVWMSLKFVVWKSVDYYLSQVYFLHYGDLFNFTITCLHFSLEKSKICRWEKGQLLSITILFFALVLYSILLFHIYITVPYIGDRGGRTGKLRGGNNQCYCGSIQLPIIYHLYRGRGRTLGHHDPFRRQNSEKKI